MARPFRMRMLLPVAALTLAGMLGGCVVYPAYPAYPGYSAYPAYGYGYAPHYSGGYVGYGGGWQR